MLDKVLQWMTAELKQELRASKVNQTGERRVFDEALQRMTAQLKQEIRATKVNQTVEGKVKSSFRERRVKIVTELSSANEPTRRYPALPHLSTVLEKKINKSLGD